MWISYLINQVEEPAKNNASSSKDGVMSPSLFSNSGDKNDGTSLMKSVSFDTK
jgi:hypothetical protein